MHHRSVHTHYPNVRHLITLAGRRTLGLTWKAWTMRRVSQRVPEPLRRTSSGGMGMIVAREKMNGWMYLSATPVANSQPCQASITGYPTTRLGGAELSTLLVLARE
eukprot:scaffold207812_cov18-Prasinocladus_malaysianus.AAC.1